MTEQIRKKQAKFWKTSVILLGIISLSTGLYKGSGFWSSYVLDIAGPAWGYVLIRAQYRLNSERFMNIRFSPEIAFLVIVGICFIIEAMQFFEIYNSTFDPYDLLSYFSGVLVVYLVDKNFNKRKNGIQQKI
jgi:hypothetical protein